MQQRSLIVLRRPSLLKLLPYSKSTLQNRIHNGLIPPPVPLGGRCVGWLESEINQILEAMFCGASNNEIQILVSTLVEARSTEKSISYSA